MELSFVNTKLNKILNSEKEIKKHFGESANSLTCRLRELRSFACLADIPSTPPQGLHPLHGKREGQFAVYLKHPFRLVLRPNHDPLPTLADGGVDLAAITAVTILEVIDYHGEKKPRTKK